VLNEGFGLDLFHTQVSVLPSFQTGEREHSYWKREHHYARHQASATV